QFGTGGASYAVMSKLRCSVPSTLLASIAVIVSAFDAEGAITSVANAASFVKDKSLTPGSIFTILGSGLTSATVTLPSPLSPAKSLGGVTVTVGGVASN